ncbi:glycosyltransferase family 4 protein [Candidatus Aerophobetes bacterium]|nr:glycosyltransferase family 4 protein [Candidatus Aerophobetes bacterium]
MQKTFSRAMRISFVSTYPPRRCGIAAFTQDLANSISQIQEKRSNIRETVQIVALTNTPQGYNYGKEICFEIRTEHRADYQEAANFLNLSDTEIICLQHEFGIFGGRNGAYILDLLDDLRKPVVTTLHTVLEEPTRGQLEVLKSICSYSIFVVVQAQKAINLLVDIYEVPREKIIMIHHGTPNIPFLDSSYYKDRFQAEGRRVILTFGFLNPKKGIEVAIEAIASIIREFPDLLYIVVGATHPEVKRRFGEEYRAFLERLVKQKGLTKHVIFYNRFVSLEQLIGFLNAADIYLTPYLSKEQIVSGTLAYAVACGKAIISTPYRYAEELLADERGILVPFRNANVLAKELRRLLNDETRRNYLRKRAYQFGRRMIWPKVAHNYIKVFKRALQEYRRPALNLAAREWIVERPSLSEINLEHLRLLTDDTGILQHAVFITPDRSHGYSTDDNARALLVTIMNWKLFKEDDILPLLQIYLSFLNYALNKETHRVRNFMSYERRWLEEVGSEDSQGRALWSLGMTILHSPTDSILGCSTGIFREILPAIESFTSPRAWAYSILGCLYYLQRFGGDLEVQRICNLLIQRLLKLFIDNESANWPWGEDIVAYDNARLPQALIAAGRIFKEEKIYNQGLHSLEWLLKIQTNPEEGHLSLIGNNGWFKRGGEKAQFDQQPIEVAGLIDACYEAYLLTREKKWIKKIDWCFHWFLGSNDVHQVVYDFSTGGCRDGLEPTGVNQNEGAESTLSWLMALHRICEITHQQNRPF